MTDDQLQPAPPPRRREHPIIAGVVALAAVAVVVGAVIGGGALVATKALGLDDEDALDAKITNTQTLFLPEPTDTATNPNPDITLSGDPTSGSSPSAPATSDAPTKEPPPISLSAVQTEVTSMQNIDLSGVYPDGEGAVLRVQQFEDGTWTDFPVYISVTGGQFDTYIQTGSIGLNKFRVINTDNGEVSNVIRVTVG